MMCTSVVKVPHKTLLMDALKEETTIVYDFCMCNPPFFANQLEAKVGSWCVCVCVRVCWWLGHLPHP